MNYIYTHIHQQQHKEYTLTLLCVGLLVVHFPILTLSVEQGRQGDGGTIDRDGNNNNNNADEMI
jgi:hypothetical protein